MRKLFLTIAGAAALFAGSFSVMPAADAQPYGYRPPPPRHYAPPPPRGYYGRPAYRPRCVVRTVRVWNGYRYVLRDQRVCR